MPSLKLSDPGLPTAAPGDLTSGTLCYVVIGGVSHKTTLGNLKTYLATVGWDAADIAVDDAGTYFAGTDTEAVLQEIGAALAGLGGLVDVLTFKGVIDCSANPNYPAADAGAVYVVSVAGKIGGGSGPNVQAGDTLICRVDATAAGNHATVGANWTIIQANIDGAVIGPVSAVDNQLALFDGTSGKLIEAATLSGLLKAISGVPAAAGYADVAAVVNAVTALSISSGVVNIDCALGDYFTLALTANVTSITFSNLPGSGKGATKWIEIVQDSTPRTVAWPASFKWEGGSAGAVSTGSGAVDELAITTLNNGTAWKASLAKAFA